MREILFCGKSEEMNRWFFGDLLNWKDGGREILVNEDDALEKIKIKVIPETVGEFTGMNDKNHKKIFEHNILCFKFEEDGKEIAEYGEVIFHDRGWAIKYSTGYIDELTEKTVPDFEIVGNIFDNPELLKEGAENA